jgi:hypothetical protein
MSYTSPARPGEPPLPAYRFAPGTPDKNGGLNGCSGCAFQHQLAIRCSRIPCHRFPGLVAHLIEQS